MHTSFHSALLAAKVEPISSFLPCLIQLHQPTQMLACSSCHIESHGSLALCFLNAWTIGNSVTSPGCCTKKHPTASHESIVFSTRKAYGTPQSTNAGYVAWSPVMLGERVSSQYFKPAAEAGSATHDHNIHVEKLPLVELFLRMQLHSHKTHHWRRQRVTTPLHSQQDAKHYTCKCGHLKRMQAVRHWQIHMIASIPITMPQKMQAELSRSISKSNSTRCIPHGWFGLLGSCSSTGSSPHPAALTGS